MWFVEAPFYGKCSTPVGCLCGLWMSPQQLTHNDLHLNIPPPVYLTKIQDCNGPTFTYSLTEILVAVGPASKQKMDQR